MNTDSFSISDKKDYERKADITFQMSLIAFYSNPREALIKSGAQDAGISYADVVRFFVRNSFAVPIA